MRRMMLLWGGELSWGDPHAARSSSPGGKRLRPQCGEDSTNKEAQAASLRTGARDRTRITGGDH